MRELSFNNWVEVFFFFFYSIIGLSLVGDINYRQKWIGLWLIQNELFNYMLMRKRALCYFAGQTPNTLN
jgi:hypothetical protein